MTGEALIEQAISLETAASTSETHTHQAAVASDGAKAEHSHDAGDDALVSRDVQRAGLPLATTLTGGALGVIFAVVWNVCTRRVNGRATPNAVALALAGWLAVAAVPFLIIPPNPPAVGSSESIDHRTAIWFVAVLLGLGAVIVWYVLRRWIQTQNPTSPLASIYPVAASIILIATGWMLMPATGTDYSGFPADLLWNFRMSAAATQLTLWVCLGLSFQFLIKRYSQRDRRP
ncbi:putative integral membrane protein (plasmid) [Paenarthrobacter aurescens TC1]|jgi:predicted cobalt transporter CbtA|uniref:Integral membrane protein n=2 Tax=Paenarthrobacter aurescens TaxID=43663 RepID=A1RDI9_PAEAT|nr:putative integral membrane protein [Paenarthrobacter aurescens TC1]